MSLQTKLAKQFKGNQASKSNQGTNRLMVRDSHWYAIGALIGFINNRTKRIRFSFVLLSTLLMALSIFFTNNTYATSSSITVSISDSTIDLNVAPTGQGAFSKSSASTIGVSTTNYTGYTLSIAAQEGDNPTALVNGSDSSKTLSSINSAITESQFKALDSTSYNNQWGYLPSNLCTTSNGTTTCSANTSFLPSPSTEGDILDVTTTANSTVNEYEITLGAMVDTTATMGSYSNTFVLYATANAIPYTITYLDNVVSSMPTDVSSETEDSSVTISSNTPTRNGYTFIGWCTVTPTHNANGTDTCPSPGTQVAPGGTLAISQTASANNFTLYAMWSGNYTIGALVSSSSSMQDLGTMTTENKAKVISTMVTDTNYVLKDSRDDQSYNISKLRDGSVWMTTNLNIAGGTTLNAGTSDVNADYTLPTSSETGFSSDTTAYVYNSGNTSGCGASGQNVKCYSYYSYIAATAGSGPSVTGNGQDAPYSICPKGWRLPTSGSHEDSGATSITGYKRGDFYKLATAYGVNLESTYYENSATFYNNLGPGTSANFLLSGNYNGSTFYYGGAYGYYWSSTGGSATTYTRNLAFGTGFVNSASNDYRRNGFSVRCILAS